MKQTLYLMLKNDANINFVDVFPKLPVIPILIKSLLFFNIVFALRINLNLIKFSTGKIIIFASGKIIK